VLGTPDALLHALVHRVAHHNSSVDALWLYDMHVLAAHMNASEWDTFTIVAEDSRVCGIASDGLEQLCGVFGSPVPRTVRTRLQSTQGEESAALLGGTLTELRLQWINFTSLPGVRNRAAFLRAHLMPPAGELPIGPQPQWRLPTAYVGRAVHGVRKWLQPISRLR
jgi:hypothetical protein